MKKFNKDIEIKVSVDSIAEKLLSTINPEEKHAELITESIIGSLINSSGIGISILYNALNGYNNEIDFKVGDTVICEESSYMYVQADKRDEHDNPIYERKHREIGKCVIKAIDLYKSDKLHIEFSTIDRNGQPEIDEKWVDHKHCSKVESPIKKMLGQEIL